MNKLSIIAAAAAVAAVAAPGTVLADGKYGPAPTDPYVEVVQEDDDFGILPWIVLGGAGAAAIAAMTASDDDNSVATSTSTN